MLKVVYYTEKRKKILFFWKSFKKNCHKYQFTISPATEQFYTFFFYIFCNFEYFRYFRKIIFKFDMIIFVLKYYLRFRECIWIIVINARHFQIEVRKFRKFFSWNMKIFIEKHYLRFRQCIWIIIINNSHFRIEVRKVRKIFLSSVIKIFV